MSSSTAEGSAGGGGGGEGASARGAVGLGASLDADREGALYGSKVVPDEVLAPGSDGRDTALEAAKKWLAGLRK